MVADLLNWMSTMVHTLGQTLIALLPVSPFRNFINSFNVPEYVGFINWFFPVSEFLAVMALWLTAISLFYLYSIIMRWIKVIGS